MYLGIAIYVNISIKFDDYETPYIIQGIKIVYFLCVIYNLIEFFYK